MRPVRRTRGERGLTLIELMIAVTLVAALMTGLLMVMRTALITYQKLDYRLESNRKTMALQQALQRQIGGMMPLPAGCAGPAGVLMGDPSSMRFVSSNSLSEGARGFPRVIEYHATADPDGGMRLMMTEALYNGVFSTAACGAAFAPGGQDQAVQMAGKLAYCRFAYQDVVPDTMLGGPWITGWNRPILPAAVRIEMAPLNPESNELPSLTLNVPMRLTRQIGVTYVDDQQ
ncbi:MAG TPA: prepilin-type N-terminal cleavage/methylation domain-containing protein [Bryobacteraceae bacterium]